LPCPRLWRRVKYEEVYLRACTNGTEARTSLTRYFRTYTTVRSHQSLEYRTPDEVYFGELAAATPVAAYMAMTATGFITGTGPAANRSGRTMK
jgi:hypothetical protein